MGFFESIQTVYSKYVSFSGRASRSEYWWFLLFYIIVFMVVSFASYSVSDSNYLVVIWELGNLLPLLAVQVRRLHDIDRSGWWVFLALIPLVGSIIVLVWFCTEGTGGDNRFGPDPLMAALYQTR